ncbi:conserved hypothetical protein [Pseudomonas sp. 8O]|nr:conserved hypothetical protein [Pseudomonas sp. 8O]
MGQQRHRRLHEARQNLRGAAGGGEPVKRNYQSVHERMERDLAHPKACGPGACEYLRFYLRGYIEGFHEAGGISGNECGRLIQLGRAASMATPKPEVLANEKPEPVFAPSARRELRLLCLLAKPTPDAAQGAFLPIHTRHLMPPRTMIRGKWSAPGYAGLYLRETQARQPSAAVLARCERHRQTNALRAPARTVRTGGLIE